MCEELLHRGPHPHLPAAHSRGSVLGLPDHLRSPGEAEKPRDVCYLPGGGLVSTPRSVDNITWLVCGSKLVHCCYFSACAGIALYPGNAQLLGCTHYYHNDIPLLVDPGKPQDIDCEVIEVTYVGPFSSTGEVSLF